MSFATKMLLSLSLLFPLNYEMHKKVRNTQNLVPNWPKSRCFPIIFFSKPAFSNNSLENFILFSSFCVILFYSCILKCYFGLLDVSSFQAFHSIPFLATKLGPQGMGRTKPRGGHTHSTSPGECRRCSRSCDNFPVLDTLFGPKSVFCTLLKAFQQSDFWSFCDFLEPNLGFWPDYFWNFWYRNERDLWDQILWPRVLLI